MSTRTTAARFLQRVIYGGESLTEVLQNYACSGLPPKDQALLRDMCFGSLRWHERLSAILDVLLTKPLKKADKDVECLLRIGLYQLIYQRTPDHAAVNETVKATKKLKKAWAGSLINGVLRGFLRRQEEILAEADRLPAARHAYPKWLLRHLQQAWPQQWEAIIDASNTHAPMTLRVNHQQQTTAAYWQALRDNGLMADEIVGVDSALQLQQAVAVDQLPGFADGHVSVQDASAQLSAQLLDCQADMRVLDACAAPGGKTCHVLERTPEVRLTAIDSSATRMQRVEENLQRLHLKTRRLVTADAADTASWWNEKKFERILLDAPCSATGVIRRHPDIKVLRRKTDIEVLQQQQARLLRQLWPTLKRGGRLLYVTCSILPEENVQQVEAFLAEQEDAIAVPIVAEWGHELAVGRQILPGEQGMDGFYYALLEKAVRK